MHATMMLLQELHAVLCIVTGAANASTPLCSDSSEQVGIKRREDIAFGSVMGKDNENYKKKWR